MFYRIVLILLCGLLWTTCVMAQPFEYAVKADQEARIPAKNANGRSRTPLPTGTRGGHRLDDVVLSENFEYITPGQLPFGWRQTDRDGGYCSWFHRNSTWEVYVNPAFSAHSGDRVALCHYNDGMAPNDDWMILPVQNLPAPITLSYWIAAQDPAYPESFEVRVSTTGFQPEDFIHLIFSDSAVGTEWTGHSHDLSQFAGSTCIIAFHYNAVNRFALKLDDVLLESSQSNAGAIAGTVVDSLARPIENATVQLSTVGRSVRTDSAGHYLLSHVPEGQYNLRFSGQYYYLYIAPTTSVAANETTRVDAELSQRPLRFWEYISRNNPRHIADFDTVDMQIYFEDTLIIWDLDISVTLTHPCVGDLDIWLQNPDSDYTAMVVHDPLNRNANMFGCRFDDQAEQPFTAGHSPYTGWWQPASPLARYTGDTTISIRGSSGRTNIWRLHVYDAAAQDEGTLSGFKMHVVTQIPDAAADPRSLYPREFSFEGNYPNPFNGETRFRFVLPREMPVTLVLYNMLGQEAARILDRTLEAGEHRVVFDGGGLASGVYLARLSTPQFTESRKVLLLK
jgi:subtilisin-like proprotein convertase family protein